MTILAAAATAVVVLLGGNLPWAGLGTWNLRIGTAVPWAIVPMALYLFAYWRFIAGDWGSPASGPNRRALLRANSLPPSMWGASLAAGLLGFAALVALLAVAARLVNLPPSSPITTPAEMPMVTAFLLLTMQSVVAGVTEEAAFRGYMQSLIERQHGLAVAILANGTLFGPLCGSLREFCTRCDPHSGPRRAKRAKRYWQPAKGIAGDIKGEGRRRPWLVC